MMNIKLPHIRTIQVLMVDNSTGAKVTEELEKLGLDVPTSEVLKEIHDELLESCEKSMLKLDPKLKGKLFPKIADIPREWMEKNLLVEAYADFFNPHYGDYAGMEGAKKMLSDPLLCRSLMALAIAGFNEDDIELHTNGKYDIEYTGKDYIMFFRYFFNINEWTLRERKSYVMAFKRGSQTTKVFKQALQGDKPKLLWQLGFSPGLTMDEMLRDMINDSYYHFKSQIQDSPEDSQRWATTFKNLAQQLDKLDADSKDQDDMYQDMVFNMQGTDPDKNIPNAEDIDAELPADKSVPLIDLELGDAEKEIVDMENL